MWGMMSEVTETGWEKWERTIWGSERLLVGEWEGRGENVPGRGEER